MQKYRDIVLDNAGNAILSATITVTDNSGGGVSTIYSDDGVTAKANPFTASGVDGAYEFYAASGHYDITIAATGFTTEQITDVILLDPAAPGPIGGTTPGAGTFTTVDASGDLTVGASNGGDLEVGDPGLEAAGININGVTYDPKFRVHDIGGTNPAQFVVHRHSTTLQPLIVGARTNNDTSSHSAVTANQGMFSILGAGYTGTHYDIFGSIDISASASGTISATSSPGKIVFNTTPDGSNAVAAALTLESDKSATFGGSIKANFTDAGVLIGNGTGAVQVTTAGTSGQVLTSNGAGVDPTFQAASGKVKQVVNVTDGEVATGTTTMPKDDSIPQITEGNEFMTLAVTPTNASNILVINVVASSSFSGASGSLVAALFQDSTADALAAVQTFNATATAIQQQVFSHRMVAGTTSATTFRVRIGEDTAGTVTFNGASGSRILGGVMSSSITITEYAG